MAWSAANGHIRLMRFLMFAAQASVLVRGAQPIEVRGQADIREFCDAGHPSQYMQAQALLLTCLQRDLLTRLRGATA